MRLCGISALFFCSVDKCCSFVILVILIYKKNIGPIPQWEIWSVIIVCCFLLLTLLGANSFGDWLEKPNKVSKAGWSRGFTLCQEDIFEGISFLLKSKSPLPIFSLFLKFFVNFLLDSQLILILFLKISIHFPLSSHSHYFHSNKWKAHCALIPC